MGRGGGGVQMHQQVQEIEYLREAGKVQVGQRTDPVPAVADDGLRRCLIEAAGLRLGRHHPAERLRRFHRRHRRVPLPTPLLPKRFVMRHTCFMLMDNSANTSNDRWACANERSLAPAYSILASSRGL